MTVTANDLRNIADGVDASNHDAEVMLARIRYGLSLPTPLPPDMNESSGPCCSEFVDGMWCRTHCDCGNSGDAEMAGFWRQQANAWVRYKVFLDDCTKGA